MTKPKSRKDFDALNAIPSPLSHYSLIERGGAYMCQLGTAAHTRSKKSGAYGTAPVDTGGKVREVYNAAALCTKHKTEGA
jgi:hypothetical protein